MSHSARQRAGEALLFLCTFSTAMGLQALSDDVEKAPDRGTITANHPHLTVLTETLESHQRSCRWEQ